MKKQTRKPMVLASALILGMTVFAPIQAGAAEAIKEEVNEMELEQQQIKGKVLHKLSFGYELFMEGEDGKLYRISLHDFTDEQIEEMDLEKGADIVVKGTLLESEEFFDSFEAYKRQLPEDINEEDLAKLEVLYKELKEVEKGLYPEVDEEVEAGDEDGEARQIDEEKWEEFNEIWDGINAILEPYLPEEDLETFEEYMSFYADALQEEVSEEDLEELQAIYEEYLKLLEKDEDDLAFEKLDEFHDILDPYMNNHSVNQSFEEFLEVLEVMELDISNEDKAKLETLYKDAKASTEAAESKEDWDIVEEKWNLVQEFLLPYYMETSVSRSFDEVITDYEFEFTEEDLADLESIYEDIKELVANKDYDTAVEMWSDFFDILSPYFQDFYQNIPFKAQQIEINGKEFKVEAKETVVEKKKEESKPESKEEKATAEKDASKDKSESTSKDA